VNIKSKKEWKKPQVTTIGNAKHITKDVNVQGAGDSIFNVLDPS